MSTSQEAKQLAGTATVAIKTSPADEVRFSDTIQSFSRPILSSHATNAVFQLAKTVVSTHIDGLDDDLDWSDDSDISDDDDDDLEDMRDDDEPLSNKDSRETQSNGLSQSSAAGSLAAPVAASAMGYRSNQRAQKVDPATSVPKSTRTTEQSRIQHGLAEPQAIAMTDMTPKRSTATTPINIAPDTIKSTSSRATVAKSSTEPVSGIKPTPAVAPAQTEAPAMTKPNPLGPTAAAPYGYKIVKVRKPDGTVGKVKRPLKEGETPEVVPTKSGSAPKKAVEKASATVVKEETNEKTSQATPATVTNVQQSAIPAEHHRVSKPVTLDTKNYLEKGANPERKIRITEKELDMGDTSPLIDSAHGAQLQHGHSFDRAVKIFAWTVAIMFPLFFLGLAVTTAALKGHVVPSSYFLESSIDSVYYDPLGQVITIAASAWPIVFAAVVAQSLKMYAAYKVERGVKLMTLEQLTSSHSVGGALKQPFLLRKINWTTLLLIFIWALSPLAGQSILRMSTTRPDHNISKAPVSYFSSVTLFERYSMDESIWTYTGENIGSWYSFGVESSIVTSLLQGYSLVGLYSQDIYNNLKIPLVGNNSNADYHYSSLLGMPYWIYERTFGVGPNKSPFEGQQTNFSMPSRYFTLNCSRPVIMANNSSTMLSRNLYFTWDRSFAITALNNTKGTYHPLSANETGVPNVLNGTTPSNNRVNLTFMEPGPTGVLYVASAFNSSDYDGEGLVLYSECTYRSVRVDNHVECNGIGRNSYCGVSNQTEGRELNSTAIPLGYWFPSVLQNMTAGGGGLWSELQLFLNDTNYASKQTRQTADYYDLNFAGSEPNNDTTGTALAQNLGMVVNALWDLGQYRAIYTGPDSASWKAKPFATVDIDGDGTEPEFYRYAVVKPWLICLIVCSTLLTIAGIAAAIWETQTVGPDFLGFINTAMKKSVRMPKDISAMNARERLTALQECEVVLYDAKPNAAVGKIVLGVREEGQSTLVKTRQYR